MVAATVLTKVYEYCHLPNIEVVTLTATDGETYTTTKFKTILAVSVSSNFDTDNHINASFSGQTVTVNWAGQTDKTCTLVIFGIK